MGNCSESSQRKDTCYLFMYHKLSHVRGNLHILPQLRFRPFHILFVRCGLLYAQSVLPYIVRTVQVESRIRTPPNVDALKSKPPIQNPSLSIMSEVAVHAQPVSRSVLVLKQSGKPPDTVYNSAVRSYDVPLPREYVSLQISFFTAEKYMNTC